MAARSSKALAPCCCAMSSACWKHASAVAVSGPVAGRAWPACARRSSPLQAVHFCRPEADERRLRQLHGLLDHGQALLDLTKLQVGLGQEGQKKGTEASLPRRRYRARPVVSRVRPRSRLAILHPHAPLEHRAHRLTDHKVMFTSHVDQALGQRERRGALTTTHPYTARRWSGHHQREQVRQRFGTRLGTHRMIHGLLRPPRQPQAPGGHGQAR